MIMFSLRGAMIGVVLLFALLTVGLMLSVSEMRNEPEKPAWLVLVAIMLIMTCATAGFTWWLFTI